MMQQEENSTAHPSLFSRCLRFITSNFITTSNTMSQQTRGAPQMSSKDQLSEDTVKYLEGKHVPELMEYLLHAIVHEKPENPRALINELTERAIPPHIVIAGPPASGKGTQCEKIADYYKKKLGAPPVHISSGDLLREEAKKNTNDGKVVADYMAQGKLVPDSLVTRMVLRRLAQKDAVRHGWLLDGFPRSKDQAEALDAAGYAPNIFLLLNVPDEALVERVEGRRMDLATGKIYHMKFNPPPQDDVTLLDRLQQRPDDTRDVLIPRLQTYHKTIAALETFYAPVKEEVNAQLKEDEVWNEVAACLERRDID